MSRLGGAFATALLAGDEVAAELAVRDAVAAGLGTATIDDEIIAPALWFVGDLWARGEITVADEHLATEIALRVLALQRESARLVRGRGGHRVMLAAPAGERHVVGLRMTADLLREAGYHAILLGADVPIAALAASARRHAPDVVCLTATMPGAEDRALIAMHEIQAARPQVGFVVGGRGLGSRVRTHPGVQVCERVSDAVQAVDATVKRAALN